MVWECMCLEDLEEKDELLSHLIYYEAVLKTTLAVQWSFNNLEFKSISHWANNLSVV